MSTQRHPRRKLGVALELTVPDGMADGRALRLLDRILKVGYADAAATDAANTEDGVADRDAADAAALKIGKPRKREA